MKSLALIAIIIFLSGCATVQQPNAPVPVAQVEQRWEQHQQTIEKISSWELKGKAAVSSGTKGATVTVVWQQQPHGDYHIELYGILGHGRTELIAKGNEVRLISPEGPTKIAPNAQLLLGEHTGWYLPVENLYYWVRGIPAPTHITALELNNSGQLARLQQDGWTLTYGNYMLVDGIWLPERITLKYPGSSSKPALTVKWLSKEWIL